MDNVKNNEQERKRKELEFKYSQHFCKWLNQKTKKNYSCHRGGEQASIVDTYLEDGSGNVINIQNVSSEEMNRSMAYENGRRLQLGKRFLTRRVELEKWISHEITKKENLYTPDEKRKTILIVESDLLHYWDENYLKQQIGDWNESEFLGIYLVEKSDGQMKKSSTPNKGKVIILKDIPI